MFGLITWLKRNLIDEFNRKRKSKVKDKKLDKDFRWLQKCYKIELNGVDLLCLYFLFGESSRNLVQGTQKCL